VLSWSRLDEHVLLADAAEAMAMVAAGATRLVDLRGEASPPRFPVAVDRFPIEDLQPDQDELILSAARHVHGLASAGVTVGVYCQAGVSRTATVAIAYLLLRGRSLEEAAARVRRVRPEAMPALALWRSLERITAALGG
jgi:protein-tyrosine phosphatase